jgi:hypothetical protein
MTRDPKKTKKGAGQPKKRERAYSIPYEELERRREWKRLELNTIYF